MAGVVSRADGCHRHAAESGPPAVYLDHASTTALRPEALEAMLPWLARNYGNPSGSHSVSRGARRAVDDARDEMAAALGGEPGEVVFTSGGTEADNLAVTGALPASREDSRLVACSAVEHPAVLEPVRAAGGCLLAVDSFGAIDLGALEAWLVEAGDQVAEVSVMLVNNETGLVQPFAEVARLVRSRAPGALLHTDAVQAMPWLDVAVLAGDADLVTVSGHKFGGPKGVGALLVRTSARARLRPLLLGGPQERELRAGTPDVAGIVGMAEAARLAVAERAEHMAAAEGLGRLLVAGVLAGAGCAAEAVPAERRIAAICNVWFEAVEAEELLIVLDQLGVCASAGSACASGALDPSHVLVAMGRSRDEARSHVRFSLGSSTSQADVEQAVGRICEAVGRLRAAG
ncbi:MAG: cysteine desulfurase family protein [Acidimicrobiales bacterium]